MSLDVFLMLKENVRVDRLQNIINNNFSDIETDIWPELDVMQLDIKSGNIIDWVEMKKDDNLDEEDKKYLEINDFKSLYCITHEKEDTKLLVEIVKVILEKFDGAFGNDTDDFKPVFDKTNIDNFFIPLD